LGNFSALTARQELEIDCTPPTTTGSSLPFHILKVRKYLKNSIVGTSHQLTDYGHIYNSLEKEVI
jgi:hypothetical protein